MRKCTQAKSRRLTAAGTLLKLLVVAHLSGASFAETATFSSFSIDLPSGWSHAIESDERQSNAYDQVVTLSRLDGVGELTVMSYLAPLDVDQRTLRNLTNVDSSIALSWREWGDFAGYQYSYTEQGSFYKQWWLENQGTILFVVYRCDPSARVVEADAVVEMVASIRMVGN